MKLYKLTESDVAKAMEAPEDGMGFHIARLSTSSDSDLGVLINSEYFAPLDKIPLLESERGRIPENHNLSEGLLLSPPEDVTDLNESHQFVRRSLLLRASLTKGARMAALAATSVPPPHSAKTIAGDVFYRLSAYPADRRVLPDGSLATGTYCTTHTDITVVPSGLAAVGRYALPTRISAKHVFEIRPATGTAILYGAVTPNYGLAGGGVEVLFPNGTTPGTVAHLKQLPEK